MLLKNKKLPKRYEVEKNYRYYLKFQINLNTNEPKIISVIDQSSFIF
jgi:hypothetical protein